MEKAFARDFAPRPRFRKCFGHCKDGAGNRRPGILITAGLPALESVEGKVVRWRLRFASLAGWQNGFRRTVRVQHASNAFLFDDDRRHRRLAHTVWLGEMSGGALPGARPAHVVRAGEVLRQRMGPSDKIDALVRLLEKLAPSPFTVLIEGESGSGKELVARTVHDMSAVANGPFVAVDCGAIPDTLFESEFFGHTKGAFTGAIASKTGVLEAADGGTLFLDEVCNLSYTAQQKLLRALEQRQIQRVGSHETRPVRVRVVAASNRPLEREVAAQAFRIDLLYRLKEVSVRLLPLRDRPEDVCHLAQRCLDEFRAQLPITCRGISGSALMALMNYGWPGNVRELRNVLRQAALLCDGGGEIELEHLSFSDVACAAPGKAAAAEAVAVTPVLPSLGSVSMAELVQEHVQAYERLLIERALLLSKGNKMQATRLLKIDYKTLHRKIRQLDL